MFSGNFWKSAAGMKIGRKKRDFERNRMRTFVLIVQITILTTCVAGVAQADLVNGGFETGDANGWIPSPNSSVFVEANKPGLGNCADWWPTEGNYFAYLLAGNGEGVYTTMSQDFTVNVGGKLEFDVFFDTREGGPPYDYNDDSYAKLIFISGGGQEQILYAKSVSDVGDRGCDGWTHILHTFTQAGTYSLEFGVRNNGDNQNDSTLGVDNAWVNNLPEANDQSLTTDEDTPVDFTLMVSDADGDSLTINIETPTLYGNLTGTPPNLTYTPSPDYYGSDSFTYIASDGRGGTDSATVSITVNPIPDAPVAVDDDYIVNVNDVLIVLAFNGVLSNDIDVDGDVLTAIQVSDVNHGTLSLYSNGSFTYTPDTHFSGTDSFTYEANDGTVDSNIATVVITVNNQPVAVNDVNVTDEDTAITINVLANDTDADEDELDVISVTQPANGSAVINANNTVTYTPSANFNGTAVFTYTVSDGKEGTDSATVTITVNSVNDDPVADAGTYPTIVNYDGDGIEQVALDGSGSYDPDPDGTIISYIWTEDGNEIANGVNPTVTLSVNPHTVTLTVTDNDDANDTDTVLITVKANSAPIAYAGADSNVYAYIAADELTDVILNGTGSYDPDGDGITYTWFIDGNKIATGVSPTIQLPLGTHTIELIVNDDFLDSEPNYVVKTVLYDIPPVAYDQLVETNEDEPNDITLTASDADDDDSTLTYHIEAWPLHGSLTPNDSNDPNRTYTPAVNYYGSDRFTFTAYDGKLYSNEATVSITVIPLNDPPDAANDVAIVDVNSSNNAIYVLVNDSDPDYDVLTGTSVNEPNHGTVQDMNSYIEYTPEPNYLGSDSFEYTVTDDGIPPMNDTAVVTLTVREKPPPRDPTYLFFEHNTNKFNLTAGYDYNLTVNVRNEDCSNPHDLNDLSVLDQVEGLSVQFELGGTVGPCETFPVTLHVDAVDADVGIYQLQAECLTDGDPKRADYTELRFIIDPDPNLPDLVVTSEDIIFAAIPGVPGEPNTISATIRNKGLTRAENIMVLFEDFDDPIGLEEILTLDPNESKTVSIQYGWPDPSFRFITVTVDPDNGIKEFDENNNSGSKVYQVGEAPPMLGIIVINCSQTTKGSTGIINGVVSYEILVTGKSYPVKGGLVHVSYSSGEQELVTDSEGRFEVSVPIPNYVIITVTDGPTTGVSFYVASDVWVDDINFTDDDPNVIIEADIHAKSSNVETINDVPVTFYAYPSTGGKFQIGPTQYIDEMPPGHSQTVSTTWVNAPHGVYRIEVELGPGFSDDKNWNNKTTSCLRVGPEAEAINVVIDIPIEDETVMASQNTIVAVSVTDNNDNIMIPCVLDSLVLDFNGVDGRHVNLKPRFNWSTLRYEYSWRPLADAHGSACLDVNATLGSLIASDYVCVNVIDDVPPRFSIYTNPYWVLIGQSVQITVNASEELMNDRLTSIEVKDSAAQNIPLDPCGFIHDPCSTQWLYHTEPLSEGTALGTATVTVSGVDLRGNAGGRARYFKVIEPGEEVPDFFVSSADIDFSNSNPDIGENITIEAVIHANPGNSGPESDIPVIFYAHHVIEEGYKIGLTQYTDEIPRGANDVVSTPWQNAAEGVYIIEVRLESDKNNANNEATKALVVGDQPFAAGFVVENKTRIDRTLFEYECRVVMENYSPVRVENVQLELVEGPNNMTDIEDPWVAIGDIDADGSATSTDTCTFTVDRSVSINPAEITWRATFTVEIDDIPRIAELRFSNVIIIEPVGLADGDITGDGKIGFDDLAIMARDWLQSSSLADIYPPPPNGDDIVNFLDFGVLGGNWRK